MSNTMSIPYRAGEGMGGGGGSLVEADPTLFLLVVGLRRVVISRPVRY